MIECAVKQIYSDHPERFLLVDVRFVEHANVNDNLARLATRLFLKSHPEPTVRFVVFLETSGRDCVGEDKERAFVAEFFFQTFQQKRVLMVEHRVQAHPTHITIGRSIDCVAERHIVSRHRFRDRARRAADVKKSARHFLTCADLGECPVLLPIEINLERLSVRPDIHLRLHGNIVAAVYDRRKKAETLHPNLFGARRWHPTAQIIRQRRVNPVTAPVQDLDFAPGR